MFIDKDSIENAGTSDTKMPVFGVNMDPSIGDRIAMATGDELATRRGSHAYFIVLIVCGGAVVTWKSFRRIRFYVVAQHTFYPCRYSII